MAIDDKIAASWMNDDVVERFRLVARAERDEYAIRISLRRAKNFCERANGRMPQQEVGGQRTKSGLHALKDLDRCEGVASDGEEVVSDSEFGVPENAGERRCYRPLEIVANRIRDADLQEVLDNLPWRERRVIELRYGLGDKGPMTLEDIGQEVGVTRERVRQIESKTLAMLKSSGGADRLAGTADEA